MYFSDPWDENRPGRWGSRERAKTNYPYCIFARFIIYSVLVYVTKTVAWGRLAIAVAALGFLLWVGCNWSVNKPEVWWPREQLMVFLSLVSGVQLMEDDDTRWVATAAIFGIHLLFSSAVCYIWYARPLRAF